MNLPPIVTFGVDRYQHLLRPHIAPIKRAILAALKERDMPFAYRSAAIGDLPRLRARYPSNPIAVIGWIQSEEAIASLRRMAVVVVNLCESRQANPEAPAVLFTGEGERAASHFVMEGRVRQFGYVGLQNDQRSTRCLGEFSWAIRRHGTGPVASIALGTGSGSSDSGVLDRMIQSLQCPSGIFCANEIVARIVLNRVELFGLRVPEDISILAVQCMNLTDDPDTEGISHVSIDRMEQGRRSVELLERCLRSPSANRIVRIEAGRLNHGTTTQPRSLICHRVRLASAFIKDNPQTTPEEVARRIGITVRRLSSLFATAGLRTIAKEIDAERFMRACKLARTTNRCKLAAIAGLAGYSSEQQMRKSFQRHCKMTPSRYITKLRTDLGR